MPFLWAPAIFNHKEGVMPLWTICIDWQKLLHMILGTPLIQQSWLIEEDHSQDIKSWNEGVRTKGWVEKSIKSGK